MRVAAFKQLRMETIHFVSEQQAHRKARLPIEEVHRMRRSFDGYKLDVLSKQPASQCNCIRVMLPSDSIFGTKSSLRDGALRRPSRDSAKIESRAARRIHRAKERPDIVHTPNIVEKNRDRQLDNPVVRNGSLGSPIGQTFFRISWFEERYCSSPSSRPSFIAFKRSSFRFARSAARLTSSEPTSSSIACSAPSPCRGPRRTILV